MALSSFRCHYLSIIGDILILVWTLNEPQVKGKQKANSKAQTFSPYTQWENKCLFSWPTLPHLLSFLSLLHPSIPRSCGFFITTLLSGKACSLLLAFTLAFFFLHLSTACGLTYTLASDVSHLILLTPLSLSLLGGGHQPTGAICLHVMEVWGCGARLGPSRPSGEGQPRQMPKH